MNTVKSFWLGMGSLCVAGGAAYYFAKQSINADRQTRFEADQRRRQMAQALEHSATTPNKSSTGSPNSTPRVKGQSNGGPARNDHSGSPSQEASSDPAATRHAPATEGQRVMEKSKYEASEPYRSKKGDRFN